MNVKLIIKYVITRICMFPTLILKLYVLQEVFPFGFNFMQSSMKVTYLFTTICWIF